MNRTVDETVLSWQSRDLISWSSDLRATMKAEEKVSDAASAQGLKTEHEHIKAEIEAREEEFSKVVESGGSMIEEQHYASAEVEERVNKVSRGDLGALCGCVELTVGLWMEVLLRSVMSGY